jgi:DNA (cytosine-5)-methyltransferase 1
MRYGSVCSGIEAASVAWAPLGWSAAFVSEIDKFPCAVLAHRFPDVPLHGDFTTIEDNQYEPIDLLVGGTPCQSFSIAGLRGGLDDDRGNLALEYLRLAQRLRPRWLVWENVPGVLSSGGGRDFGSILGGLVELGYGFSYRVLDAQYVRVDGFARAVPQRRRRVFVVGYIGDWRRAAAVLFERESLSGHPAPRRKARERIADSLTVGARSSGGIGYDNQAIFSQNGDNLIRPGDFVEDIGFEVCGALSDGAHMGGGLNGQDAYTGRVIPVAHAIQAGALRENPASGPDGVGVQSDLAYTLEARSEVQAVTHALRAEGFDASEDGTGRGTPLVPTAFDAKQSEVCIYGDRAAPIDTQSHSQAVAYSIMPMNSGRDYKARETDVSQPIMAGGPVGGNQGGDYVTTPVPFDTTQITSPQNGSKPQPGDPSHPLAAGAHAPAIASPAAVRRLTPTECERLQGFPDGWTAIPWRNKDADACPDGPRYKALGNSMAVNVMRWIGQRIAMVDSL